METIKKVFVFLFFTAVLYSCAQQDGEQGTTTTITDLPPDEQQEVLSYSDTVLGETALLTETELNPIVIEQSLNEVEGIITSRAPLIPKEETPDDLAKDAEGEVSSELEYSQNLSFIGKDKLEKLEKLKNRIDDLSKYFTKYSNLLRAINPQWVQGCKKNGQAEVQCSSFPSPLSPLSPLSCHVEFSGCLINTEEGNYTVSGTADVYANGRKPNIFAMFTLTNLRFTKEGDEEKYVEFVSGTITINIEASSSGELTASKKANDVYIIDTERNVEISGSVSDSVNGTSKYSWELTRVIDADIKDNDKGKTFSLEGKISVERSEKGMTITAQGPENTGGFILSDSDGNKIEVKISHRKIRQDDPKTVGRESSVDLTFSSPITTFSLSAYRYKEVKKEKTPDGKTFSLTITDQITFNGNVVRYYSHNLTIVKGEGTFTVNGKINIVRKDGQEISVEVSDLVLEKGCNKPTGGIMKAEIKGKVKVEVEISPGCSCGHRVKIEKGSKKIEIEKVDMCQAKEKTEKELMEDMGGQMMGGMPENNTMEDHIM